ncbi:MAG: ATP-binding protein [Acidobacteriia bacterium]|nr:ATP-binding protein [Terriglobia bacterium]
MKGNRTTGTRLPFRIHPRVFAALGADLVTNDIVAVIELVKNSYDAFATRVDVCFGELDGSPYLEVVDDGIGMDRQTLEQAWCVVATPYRQRNPISVKNKKTRRVAGEKGLGRLSAARLGGRLDMLTKAADNPCWQIKVDWSSFSSEEDLSTCFVYCEPCNEPTPFGSTGTRVRVLDLTLDWDEQHIAELQDNLARLASPFSQNKDFTIHLTPPNSKTNEVPVQIVSPEFLDKPPYAIRGHVTAKGAIHARYEYAPLSHKHARKVSITKTWKDVCEASDSARRLKERQPHCGPFEFDIRAWDIGADDTQEIAERYEIAKGNVRKAIRAHKGISVYRDGILVLPKSEAARDWLGLDLRRVSRTGTRLSTSQIVGYVSISADSNSAIEDTSDRERLASSPAVIAFQEILRLVVHSLESERDADRAKPGDEVKLDALLDGVSADDLLEEVNALAEEGAPAQEAVVRVEAFSAKLRLVREALKKRFVYYSRLATVGTIAQMLVHEIRNRTTAIGRFLRASQGELSTSNRTEFDKQLKLAESAVYALERLADTFAPLANRGFRRGRRTSVLEESISRCLSLLEGDLRRAKVHVAYPDGGATTLAIDPGELDTIILNLLLNAVYWITKSHRNPKLDLAFRRTRDGQRVRVTISDSGPGVAEKDAERIFLPGVTRKPDGIGMGLTVAAELVSDHGGKISLSQPGKLDGATFTFDLPAAI